VASERGSVATRLEPLITGLLGQDPPIGLRFWDDSVLGPPEAPAQLVVRSPMALRYLIYGRGELGLARAYVSGTLDVEGDIYAALGLRDALAATTASTAVGIGPKERLEIVRLALTLGILGPPPPVPPEEIRLTGGRHTKARDQAAISAHYDISNDFYALVLGETMTYSCAYFATDDMTLDDAQRQKCDHICRKLGLEPSMRLLDVGCGWGSMLLHAASHYGVTAVGITISRAQAELARARVKAAGLAGSVEIRVQDYRDVADGPFDAISSIGMFEHVGQARLKEYFSDLYGLLSPRGRLCNHAISRPGARGGARPELGRNTFIDRYVFPDGELHEVGTVVSAMQNCGFEVRDVESLREHYARTLRAWVENLESHFEDAVGLVGAGRARVWRLYMAASALNFQAGRTNVHQVLGVRQDSGGGSGMPATRAGLYAAQRVSLASSTG
jgi:cyclopropane-fatty-acyl-phospholipid synthase